jgi:hypothetical protein
MSGGGEPTYSIEDLDKTMTRIKPPAWAEPAVPGIVDVSLDEEKSNALDGYYRRETMRAAQALQGPTPQEQTVEAMRLITRESAAGRIPDPDYDIVPRASDAYKGIDSNALALQRARDYADDLEQELKARGEEHSKVERERIIANRQAEELKRLSEIKATDEERTRARDDRRMRLLLGKSKLKAGSSLLSDEQTSSGSTLLTG